MNLDPLAAPRTGTDLGRRLKWIEDRLKYLASSGSYLSNGSITGGNVTVQEILTAPADSIAFVNNDQQAAAGPGTLTMTLSHTPIAGSLQIWWGDIPQPPTEWTLAGNVVTIPDPTNLIKAGHIFTAYYAYDTTNTSGSSTVYNWGSSGPNLTVAEGDTTDFSATSFDDSSWLVTAAPAGHPLGPNGGMPAWPPVVFDTSSTNRGVWLRRKVTVSVPSTITVSARVDGEWWLYSDGASFASDPTHSGVAEVGPYTFAVAAGAHVIALHVNDEPYDPGRDYLYADLNVVVTL